MGLPFWISQVVQKCLDVHRFGSSLLVLFTMCVVGDWKCRTSVHQKRRQIKVQEIIAAVITMAVRQIRPPTIELPAERVIEMGPLTPFEANAKFPGRPRGFVRASRE